MTVVCAVCGNPDLSLFHIGGARRAHCPACQHEQRVDIEAFNYTEFAMGATGTDAARLQSQVEFLARHLPKNARILELGCAAGGLAHALRPRLPVQAYHGIELSPAKEIAAQVLDRVYNAPLPSLLRQGDIAASSYDAIITSHCLEHIGDVGQEVAGIRAALADAGVLFIEVPNRSGHPALPYDDNRSHLHFFSVSSLTRLLARHGLEATALETGAWHDARYPDCIRAIARPAGPGAATHPVLSSHALLAGVGELVVWGAGKMVTEMLAHYFDPLKISFFVDQDARKHGTLVLGRPVLPPAAINDHAGCTILINSLEYEGAIRVAIQRDFSQAGARILAISELLDGLDG